ncbi:acyl-CoA dehydrogenase family protein [Zavarzinia sp. CC-PAN008]|uniref:acyl-CoA dehydrogenase family protein n=1 Tax=Zavarzinia sp. CC-PAN008 TaxID=3243332 RepID=UPI003F749F43
MSAVKAEGRPNVAQVLAEAGIARGAALTDPVGTARRIADRLAVDAAQRDLHRILPHPAFAELRAAGIQAVHVPAEFGGSGASFPVLSQVVVQLARGDSNVAQALLPHFCFLDLLRLEGSRDQRARWFGAIAKGAVFANAFAERGGTVVGEISTRLHRKAGQWRLDGRKFYSTGSLFADYLYIGVLKEDDALAMVVVPADRAGITIVDDWDGWGQRTTGSGTTLLKDVHVADDEVIHLDDFGKARSFFGASAQIQHAAVEAGIALAALEDGARHARTNARPTAESGLTRATEDPYILHALGEIAVQAEVAQAIVARAADTLEHAASLRLSGTATAEAVEAALVQASLSVAAAKAAAEQAALFAGEKLLALGGATGGTRALGLDRHWRNARVHTTHDPIAYKFRTLGDWHLNHRPPPISTKY